MLTTTLKRLPHVTCGSIAHSPVDPDRRRDIMRCCVTLHTSVLCIVIDPDRAWLLIHNHG